MEVGADCCSFSQGTSDLLLETYDADLLVIFLTDGCVFTHTQRSFSRVSQVERGCVATLAEEMKQFMEDANVFVFITVENNNICVTENAKIPIYRP